MLASVLFFRIGQLGPLQFCSFKVYPVVSNLFEIFLSYLKGRVSNITMPVRKLIACFMCIATHTITLKETDRK